MKQFLIINGKKARLIERATIEDAKRTAENICGHSKEIIVREIDLFINMGTEFLNPKNQNHDNPHFTKQAQQSKPSIIFGNA